MARTHWRSLARHRDPGWAPVSTSRTGQKLRAWPLSRNGRCGGKQSSIVRLPILIDADKRSADQLGLAAIDTSGTRRPVGTHPGFSRGSSPGRSRPLITGTAHPAAKRRIAVVHTCRSWLYAHEWRNSGGGLAAFETVSLGAADLGRAFLGVGVVALPREPGPTRATAQIDIWRACERLKPPAAV